MSYAFFEFTFTLQPLEMPGAGKNPGPWRLDSAGVDVTTPDYHRFAVLFHAGSPSRLLRWSARPGRDDVPSTVSVIGSGALRGGNGGSACAPVSIAVGIGKFRPGAVGDRWSEQRRVDDVGPGEAVVKLKGWK